MDTKAIIQRGIDYIEENLRAEITAMELADMTTSESREMVPEIRMVTRKIVTTQRAAFCRSRF